MSERFVATIKELIEAGDSIRCYPSGAVGFDEWYEAQEKAQELLSEFLDEEGNWHPIAPTSGDVFLDLVEMAERYWPTRPEVIAARRALTEAGE